MVEGFLMHNIPLWSKPIPQIAIHCDSQSALAKAYSDVYNGKSLDILVEEIVR